MSIVVYRPNLRQLAKTFSSLLSALERLGVARPDARAGLYVVDNGDEPEVLPALDELRARGVVCTLIGAHGNVGYGCGHNLAIERAASRYHLILNPDVDLDANSLVAAFDFFDAHPGVGLVTPRVDDEHGQMQYLCRRYPTLLDLFVRGFMPAGIRRLFARRLARYEMRDIVNATDVAWDPAIVSGCFMLFRTDVLKALRGFDARYFLYFEDYDLSLRTHDIARVAYVPTISIRHYGGGAARKGMHHVCLFVMSAFRFFNRFGWKWR
ncbi:glycosyltransferase family 2 protein [Burkholderia oklahomensis]|uniref:glycosyltransferase family 2 protein n=1 Tax=Burkholderia oklahomensis TaxID=342113 RepID=UPI002654CDBE|nr:glycosyltransferase family 2 protein [Burkholderia oklahomensis]MDN7675968.1 glycosyltransferase family 2 protein [Burkholderia oklahomensis]